MATGTLTSTTIKDRYKSLLKVTGTANDVLVADTLSVIEDGDGNDSCFQLADSRASFVLTGTTGDDFIVGTSSVNMFTVQSDGGASNIAILANSGATDTVVVTNTQGTNASAISLIATAGGITAKVADEKSLQIGNAALDAYFIVAASATAGSEDVRMVNTNGTDAKSIEILSSAGGVSIECADEKEAYIGNNAKDAYVTVAASATAGSEDIRIVNTNGTDEAAIALTASAGGISLDGNVSIVDIDAALTANVGSSQGDGALTKTINHIATCANAGDAVTLPTAVAGKIVFISNHGGNSADVFPATGDVINDGTANAALALADNKCAIYWAVDATNWNAVVLA